MRVSDPLAGVRVGVAALIAVLIAAALGLSPASAGAQATVSLDFDDGWNELAPAEEAVADHGLRGTFFIITSRVGTGHYLSWDQIQSIYADGNEIAGHTRSHRDLTTLTPDQQRDEICGGREDLLARGYPQVSFAYPYGRHDASSERLVQECGYASGRGSGGLQVSPAESAPPLDRWAIRTRNSVTTGDTAATLEGWVRQAEAVGGWVNIVFHRVCDPALDPTCAAYSISPTEFDAFLDWLQGRQLLGTRVSTVGEVIAANPQPLLSVSSVRSRRDGTARLRLYVGCSGDIRVSDARHRARVRKVSAHAADAGVVAVTLQPNAAGRRALIKRRRFGEEAEVTFAPFSGTSTSQPLFVRLKRPRGG